MNQKLLDPYMLHLNHIITNELMDSEEVFVSVEYFIEEVKDLLDRKNEICVLSKNVNKAFIIELALLYESETVTLRDIRSLLTMWSWYVEKLHLERFFDSINDYWKNILQKLEDKPDMDWDFKIISLVQIWWKTSEFIWRYYNREELFSNLKSIYKQYYLKECIINISLIMTDKKDWTELVDNKEDLPEVTMVDDIKLLDGVDLCPDKKIKKRRIYEVVQYLDLWSRRIAISLMNDESWDEIRKSLFNLSNQYWDGLIDYLLIEYDKYNKIPDNEKWEYWLDKPWELFLFWHEEFQKEILFWLK